MKNYLYVLLMSFALTTIQSQGLEYGLKAGLNLNSSGDITNILDEYSSIGQTKEAINGFNFGVFLQLKLAMLYLRPEIHFSKFETSYDALTVGKSRLEAPVSVGFKFLPFLSAFAGPTYRYGLSGKNDDYTIESLKGESTLGLHLGARLHLGKLGIDARIERGISENEVKLLSDRNVNIGTIDQRTTVLSVGLSYAF
ncbi:hypothetical protein N9V25_01955 [Flavobacteriaceae bacterium]|jgi:hypothetical protein|nr:hypothetical protein [Flavobacteriaceae bacterium]MDB2327810.1 hypothetical protein [Flavobacteriaceae bacterium]